jgi:hypothetical protein
MQNNRYWSSQNPHLIHKVAFHSTEVEVLCAESASIVVPVPLNETINCERDVQVILEQFFPRLTEEERLDGWFQQDLVTDHTARMSMQALSEVTGRELSASKAK